MKASKKLINDTFLYGIAHFGSAALTFLMLPIYTTFFTPEQFGTWDLLLTTATLLVPFVTFELTSATYRWLIDKTTTESRATIISTGFFQIAKNVIIFNIVIIGVFLLFKFNYQWETLLLINVTILSSFLQQCTRGLQRNKLFAIQGIMQTAIIVVLNIIFIIFFKLGIEGIFYAYIIANTITAGFVSIKLNFKQYIVKTASSKPLLKNYLTYAIPIIPATASWWVMTMADRWVIAGFLGLAENGIYAVAIKIPAILLMVNTVFSLAWKDSAITTFHQSEKNVYYSNIFKHYFRLMATSVICLILVAKPIIALFIHADYFTVWKYTGILLIATLFNALALFWSAGFHGAKKTRSLLTTTIIGAALNVVLNVTLAPFLGLYGVAVATAIAFFATWILRIIFAKKYFHIKIPLVEMICWAGGIALSFIPTFFGNGAVLVVSIGVAVGVFVLVNKSLIVRIVQSRW